MLRCVIMLLILLGASCGEESFAEEERTDGDSRPRVSARKETLWIGPEWTRVLGSQQDSPRALAIDRFLPFVVYASGSGGVYTSWSLGAQWRRSSSDAASEPATLYADPNRAGVAWAGTSRGDDPTDFGARITRDFGRTWQIEPRAYATVAVAPGDSTQRFATVGSRNPLFRSRDDGATWELRSVPTNCCASIFPRTGSDLYLIGNYDVLLRTLDAGDTVEYSSAGGMTDPAAFAVNPRRPDTIYAVGIWQEFAIPPAPAFAKSVDGGRTWAYPSDFFLGKRTSHVAVSQADARIYVVGAEPPDALGAHVYVSTDGGSHFEPADEGLGGGVRAVVPHPLLPCVAFALTDHGLYRTVEAGGTCHLP